MIFFISTALSYSAQTYVHIVTDRDDIYKLSRMYDIPTKDLARINGLDSINQKLLLYQKLIIPDKFYKTDKSGKRKVKNIKHKIEKDESLYTISRHYGVTVYDLLLLNPNIERGKPLTPNEELTVQVTLNNKSQYSQQIIYLNGDLIKFEEIIVKDSSDLEAVKRLNEDINQRILQLNQYTPDKNMFEDFTIPIGDTSNTSRYLYHLIRYSLDSQVNKQPWLDSLYEEILYVKSELRTRKIKSDHRFLVHAFSILFELNHENPDDEFLLGLRCLCYYWLGNYRKALVFSDEAVEINPENEPANIVRAAIGEEDNHLEYASRIFRAYYEFRPERNFSLYNLATLSYLSLDYSKAIELYSELITRSPDMMAELYYRIGHCYMLMNDAVNGCEYLKESEKLHYIKASSMRTRLCK